MNTKQDKQLRLPSFQKGTWSILLLAILFSFSFLYYEAKTVESQSIVLDEEICDNGIDDDGDGLIDYFDPDCYDVPDCYTIGIAQDTAAFIPVLKCDFVGNPVTYAPPMFADIDGDGETEVVVISYNNPDGFVVINTDNCAVEYSVDIGLDIQEKDGGLCLGDVDGDGYVDVFVVGNAFGLQYRMKRYEYDPNTGTMQEIWNTVYNGFAIGLRPHVDIIDLNQDGQPELIPNRGQMVNAITGNTYPGNVPQLNNEGKGLFAFTAHADPGEAPAGQGNVEVIRGSRIYRYDFINQNWVTVRSQSSYDWGSTANVSIADLDADGDVDAIISNYNTGTAFIWDLQTDELLGEFDYPGNFGSRANITNLDGDVYPEMIMTSNQRIFAIDDIVTTGSFGNILWLQNTADDSGHTQTTSFDFDNDGNYEIVYRDYTQLLILQGNGTGIPTGGYPSGPQVLLGTGEGTCTSITGMEYPTIGDIDNDDHAEIVATCEGRVSIYESGGFPWGDAVSVWNTNAYNIVNVNPDGTIPAVMQENYLLFNNFLSQIHPEPPYDTILVPTPDMFVETFNFASDCEGDGALVFEICNQGDTLLPGPFPIAFYDNDPQFSANLIDVFWYTDSISNDECDTIFVQDVVPISEGMTIYALINDNGSVAPPLDLAGPNDFGDFPTFLPECDYPNNLDSLQISLTFTVNTALQETICGGESYTVGTSDYSETGMYVDTLTAFNGCDSLVALDLEVLTVAETPLVEMICAGESITIGNSTYTETGIYSDTLAAANGCDSIITLELSVSSTYFEPIDTTICAGTSYAVGTSTYTETGNYIDTLQTSSGCDSIIALDLLVEQLTNTIDTTIFAGGTYTIGNSTYTDAGTYTDTLQTITGCDSIVVSILTLDQIIENVAATICEGESFLVGNMTYNLAGYYTDTLQTAQGFDSIVILNLNVNPIFETPNPQTICAGESIEVGNSIYNTTGNYTDTLQTINSCDSIIQTDLVVVEAIIEPLAGQICDGQSYFVGTSIYTEAGNYIDTLVAASGCDSVVQLTLEVVEQLEMPIAVMLCAGESYTVGTSTYFATGNYIDTLTSTAGCDSIVYLDLEVHPIFEILNPQQICAGESYSIGNSTYTIAGSYTDTLQTIFACDSIIYTNLELLEVFNTPLEMQICIGESVQIGSSIYDETGNYLDTLLAQNGCDSIVALDLEVLTSFNETQNVEICTGDSYFIENQEFTQSGEYEIMLISSGGCDSIINLNLAVNAAPFIENEAEICSNDSLFLGGAFQNTTGIYLDTLQTPLGCDSIVQTNLTVYPEIIISGEDALICPGDTAFLEVVGATDFTWSPTDGLTCFNCPNPVATPTETTIYTVTSEGCLGTTASTEILVEVEEPIGITIVENQELVEGESIVLNAENGDEFIWRLGDSVLCEYCPELLVAPIETTAYELQYTDENGCIGFTNITVQVLNGCPEAIIEIPNIISPNNDGSNDVFFIKARNIAAFTHLRIYNRWGEQIFESTDINEAWDGTFRGQNLAPDVYVYYMEYICLNGRTEILSGNVTILK